MDALGGVAATSKTARDRKGAYHMVIGRVVEDIWPMKLWNLAFLAGRNAKAGWVQGDLYPWAVEQHIRGQHCLYFCASVVHRPWDQCGSSTCRTKMVEKRPHSGKARCNSQAYPNSSSQTHSLFRLDPLASRIVPAWKCPGIHLFSSCQQYIQILIEHWSYMVIWRHTM